MFDDEPQTEFSRKIGAAMRETGISSHGSEWIEAYCNPVGNYETRGIPTSDARKVAIPRFCVEDTVSVPNGPGATAKDIYMVFPGGSNTAALIGVAEPGIDIMQAILTSLDSYQVLNIMPPLPAEQRTVSLEGTSTTSAYTATPPRSASSFRCSTASITVYNTSSDLNNGGTIYAASFDGVERTGVILDHGVIRSEWLYSATLSPDYFTRYAPRAFTGPAKEGVYIPVEVIPGPYVNRCFSDGAAVGVVGVGAGSVQGQFYVDSMFQVSEMLIGATVPWIAEIQTGPNPSNTFGTSDVGYDSSPLTVVVVKGAPPGASFRVKVVKSMEIVPDPSSIEVPYMRPRALFDPGALQLARTIRSNMNYGFPARYNFLGFLAGLVPKVLSGIASVGRFLLPVAKTAGRAAIAAGATKLLDGAVEKIRPGVNDSKPRPLGLDASDEAGHVQRGQPVGKAGPLNRKRLLIKQR